VRILTLRRACPICDGTRAKQVWRDPPHRYVECRACHTVFSDIDAGTYSISQHNVWHAESLASETVAFYDTARARAHAALLRREPVRGAGRLLDVGCGLGFFLERAARSGWDVYGCDPSLPWARRASARVGRQRVLPGGPEPGMFGGRRFDLITAWDVLEHVFDPLPFLETLAGLLSERGRLFVRTPNFSWVYPTYRLRRALGEEIELGPLNHVVYYRARTLRIALARAGLRPIAWPVLPPPQVGFANRQPPSPSRTLVVRGKNIHARLAELLATCTRGRIALGADLDALAARNDQSVSAYSEAPAKASNLAAGLTSHGDRRDPDADHVDQEEDGPRWDAGPKQHGDLHSQGDEDESLLD
jgi:2-polyprenyl-3-methyl-5-hydroxy-6-metoxy-1,4-benzoquinol methylase